jgi:two-component system cell cycle sensor histidine kinase/response regulator CckA
MIIKFMRKLGVFKLAVAITLAAVLTSVFSYLIISPSFGDILVKGIFVAALIPAIVSPLMAFVFLQTALRIDKSEQALLQSEEKYRNILDNIEDGYFEVDISGNFTFFNNSTQRILGYSKSEMLGMNYKKYMDEKNAKKVYQLFNRVYTMGDPSKGFDWQIITKDETKRHVEASVSLMTDSDGQPKGFRGIVRDVTERKQTEEVLRQSEERFRNLLEANPDPVIVCDMRGKVIFINPAFSNVFGWALEECLGKETDFFVPEEKRHETDLMVKELIAGNCLSGIESLRYTKQGDVIPVSISGSMFYDNSHNPAGSITNLRNVSEQKILQSQLQRAQRMEAIGTLAGGIAHDFNNLLMAIQGNASLILYELNPDDPHCEFLRNIEKSVMSGAKLTGQLLGYARKGKYQTKPINLNQLVSDAIDTIGRIRKDITIHRELERNLYSIAADQGQIEQVLLNLYVNALEAMPEGGKLFLKTKNVTHEDINGQTFITKPGNYVQLVVKDTGIGMNEETQRHIFEPFFTTKERGRGTGLGLASVFGIIKSHSGYIDVKSKKGHGTAFYIYLPALNHKAEISSEPDSRIINGTGTVLLVDDEEMVLDVGSKFLKKLGYKVLEASGGHKAVKLYEDQKNTIDLVILDMIMPEMSGKDTYERIKQINPDVKVLLSSGYSIEGQATQILNRGCDGFIQKPFNLKQMSGKLSELLPPS